MKQYIITSIILLFTITTFGQGLQLATMSEVGQVNLTNPAKFADKRFYLGVSPYANLGTNVAGTQVFGLEGGFLPYTVDLNALNDENFVNVNVQTPFAFGFKVKKWAFNVHTTPVFNTEIGFNKDFLGFATRGNGAYVGETLNLDPTFNMTLYQETGIGVSREILKIFTVGARIKFLNGVFNMNTTEGNLSLTTGEEFYQLDASANYNFQFAGLPPVNNIDDFSKIDSTVNSIIADPLSSTGILTDNRGFAFDIGATMDIGEFLHVGVSILDIGNINWVENASQYNISGEFTFEGIDATGFITGEDIENIGDTLNKIVSLSSEPTTYSAGVNTKSYITARLKLGKSFYVNGVLRNEFTSNGVRTGFGIGAQKKFGKILSLGAMYSVQNGSFVNLGANMSLKLGPAQVFAVTDNLLPLANQWQAANTNVRIGVNVTLNDKRKKKD